MTGARAETTDVRDGHRFDEGRLASYLTDHLDGFRGPVAVRQFEGGQSNPTYLLQTPQRDYVLRKKPPGQLLPSAHAVEREYRVMTALRETGVPVPVTRWMCDDHSIIGTPFFVMDCVNGRVFRQPHLPGVTPLDRARIYEHMAEVLATLHRVDAGSIGLSDYGKPGNYYARQIGRWGQQYLAAKTDEIASMDRLMAWLPAHIPGGDDAAIVHGDYRVENLIFHPTEPRIVAVVDWELSTLGHPLADVAYNCLTYHLPPEALGLIDNADDDREGMPDEREYVAMYCRHAGRSGIAQWNFYLAFSMFRLASILQGVYARGLQGNAASEFALARGAAARTIADIAWRIAQQQSGNSINVAS
jgi:aminoglycoside phosphotransferase (APT) family kinase protein